MTDHSPTTRRKIDNKLDPSTLGTPELRRHLRELRFEAQKIDYQLETYTLTIEPVRANPEWKLKATHALRCFQLAIDNAEEELASRAPSMDKVNAAFVKIAERDFEPAEFAEIMAEAKKAAEA